MSDNLLVIFHRTFVTIKSTWGSTRVNGAFGICVELFFRDEC